MARKDKFTLDDLIRLPWYVGVALAALTFVLLSFVLPPLLAGSSNPLFAAVSKALPMLGKLAAFFCLAGAGLSALRQFAQGRMLDKQSGIDSIHRLSWQQFEELCAAWFRRNGYTVIETPAGADGGVDLVLRKDGKKDYVQCKHWKQRRVGVKTVRELHGVVAAHNAARGFVVTSGEFTAEAIDFAAKCGIELLSGAELSGALGKEPVPVPTPALMPALSLDSPKSAPVAPSCPQCGSDMVARLASRGSNKGRRFWGCSNFPRCRGTATMPEV